MNKPEDKKPGGYVVSWKEKMAAVTAQAASMEAPKGGFLSFKGGRLSYDDTPIPGDKMNVVIVDFVLENTWFPEKYVAGKTVSPSCYALGRVEEELEPHEDAEDPQGSEDSPFCADCPNNEWGSDPEGGRGKACKNTRRIAIIAADNLKAPDAPAAIKKASIVMCKLPVTSVKGFSKTINQIVKVLNVPPFGVVVELSVTPSDNMFSVNWKVLEQVTDEAVMQALYEKHLVAEKLVMQPYPKMDGEPAAAKSNKY